MKVIKTVLAAVALSCLGFAANAATVTIDVTGTDSLDGIFTLGNTILTENIGAGSHVTDISWNVTLLPQGLSWYSEMSAAFGNSVEAFVAIRPGVADGNASDGPRSYVGTADLVSAGLDFFVLADGVMTIEFYETFDDVAGAVDGIWESGSFTVTYTQVPLPAAVWLLLSGLAGLGLMRRR